MRRSTRFNRPGLSGSSRSALLLNNDGDGSTLTLDFTTGVLDSRLTFTRGSTGTRINASGFVETMSNNVARFDHDPTTLAPRGLLLEAQTTNLLQYSEAVDQSPWFTAGTVASATFTGGNGPNGVNNSGSKLSATSISASSSLYYNGITLAAQTYTMSVFAKADGANWIWINVQSGGTIHGAFFDLSGNGALGNTTGTVVSGSNIITKYPNGWFRIQFTFTGTAATWFPVLLPCTSNGTGYASIAGQAPNGVLVYGAQLETGSGASSYIPTGASTATRVADSCVMTGTNFSSWYNQSQGSFFASVQKNTTVPGHIFNANTSNSAPRIMMSYNSGWFLAGENPSGTNTPSLFIATGAINASQKFAGACQTGNYAASANGLTAVTTSTGTMPTGLNTLQIGAAEGGYQFFNGTIALLKYWPTRLPNAQLQSLTT
jgi:hypothetical protein